MIGEVDKPAFIGSCDSHKMHEINVEQTILKARDRQPGRLVEAGSQVSRGWKVAEAVRRACRIGRQASVKLGAQGRF